jgi:hypothetical protein
VTATCCCCCCCCCCCGACWPAAAIAAGDASRPLQSQSAPVDSKNSVAHDHDMLAESAFQSLVPGASKACCSSFGVNSSACRKRGNPATSAVVCQQQPKCVASFTCVQTPHQACWLAVGHQPCLGCPTPGHLAHNALMQQHASLHTNNICHLTVH